MDRHCWVPAPTLTYVCRHISKTCQRWWLIKPVPYSVCPVSLLISTSTPSPSKLLACSEWPQVQRSVVALCRGEKRLIVYVIVWLGVKAWVVLLFFHLLHFSLPYLGWVPNGFNVEMSEKVTDVSECKRICSCFSPSAWFIVMQFWHLCRSGKSKAPYTTTHN